MKNVEIIRSYYIGIEFLPSMFDSLYEEEFLKKFSEFMFPVKSIDDLYKYVANMVVYDSICVQNIEGLGRASFSIEDEYIQIRLTRNYTDVELQIYE